jgi:hypothetical protein
MQATPDDAARDYQQRLLAISNLLVGHAPGARQNKADAKKGGAAPPSADNRVAEVARLRKRKAEEEEEEEEEEEVCSVCVAHLSLAVLIHRCAAEGCGAGRRRRS